MTLYIGVDFHPYQQTLAWCNTETGETDAATLKHDVQEVREFYQKFPSAIVGIESSSKAVWFENLLAETGHQLLVGNPILIRKRAISRHKSDKRDADLILHLLLSDEFPSLWRRSKQNNEILDILKLRHNLVSQRTQTYNRLSALASNFGIGKGRIKTKSSQDLLKELEVDEAEALQRENLFQLVDNLDEQIGKLESWLENKAEQDHQTRLLKTQKGVGNLCALALVNTIGEIKRFSRPTKQIPAYIGLEPLERESAGKRKPGKISRSGSWLTRFLLGQSAHISTRYDEKLSEFYKHLCKKKPKAVAKTATARKLLVAPGDNAAR